MVRVRRHECKYEIDEALAAEVRAALRPFIEPDAYAARSPTGEYAIASLYLDSAGLPLYRETVEGQDRRFKLRIRGYDEDPEHPLFLEIKRRAGGLVAKSRCPVPRRLLASVLDGTATDAPPLSERQSGIRDEFRGLVHALDARPTVVVRYDREAYVGLFDPEVRVTFDRRLRTLATDQLTVPLEASGFATVLGRRVVLELKFNDRCPGWMQTVVHRFGLARQSFSKYGHSIEVAASHGYLPDEGVQ